MVAAVEARQAAMLLLSSAMVSISGLRPSVCVNVGATTCHPGRGTPPDEVDVGEAVGHLVREALRATVVGMSAGRPGERRMMRITASGEAAVDAANAHRLGTDVFGVGSVMGNKR